MTKFSDDRETDLFGNPVRERHGKRGRPALELTSEDRDMVEAACVRGWSNARIAKSVGISDASLKRYFRATLKDRDTARDRMELAIFATTARAAIEEGSASHMRQLRDMLDRDARLAADRNIAERRAEDEEEAPVAPGKKAARLAEAKSAGGDAWGDDLLGHLGPQAKPH
ncbi:hypothetical protein ACXN5S_17850 [Pseudoroseicyclus sp. H15]